MKKIIAVVGPTASGKSELSIKLAKKFNGEIISADSRQIYKGMNIGTGKVSGKWIASKKRGRTFSQQFIYKGIVHYCIDYVNPKRRYSAGLFQRDAQKAISAILSRGKLPIICGGTAHWVDAMVYNQKLPDVKPNLKLRAQLEKKPASDLYNQLKKLDPHRAANIDRQNKRRLIRALEIIIATGMPVPSPHPLAPIPYSCLWVGISVPQEKLYKKIEKRLNQRLKQGMVKEVWKLHRNGLSWKKLESFGLEYKYGALFLQKKLTKEQMCTELLFAIKHYSKRQMTWWKRNGNINWIKGPEEANKLVKNF